MVKFSRVVAATLVAGAFAVGWANSSSPSVEVLRGEVTVAQADGSWQQALPVEGQWVRSQKVNTAIRIPGAVLRMDPGTSVKFEHGQNGLSVDAKGGRVYVALDGDSPCKVSTAKSLVRASQGEFVVDAQSDALYVVAGNASTQGGSPRPLQAWSERVALDGPDVRTRNRTRRRVTQGEENTGRRVGEDQPSSTPSASPTFTQMPAFTPTATPPPPVPPPPVPPPPAPPEVGGGPDWGVIGGIVGGLGLIGGILANNNGNDPNGIVAPITQ